MTMMVQTMASVGVTLCVLAMLTMTNGQGANNQQLNLNNRQKAQTQGTTTPPNNRQKTQAQGTTTPPNNRQKTQAQGTTTPPRPVYSNVLPSSGRIIGGSRVYDRCQAPYNAMVALQLFPNDPALKLTYCSGVMIKNDVILTAAFCVQPYFYFDSTVVTVVVGEKNFDMIDTYQINFAVNNSNFRIQPDYNNFNGDNNIALIKLPRPVTLNECLQPLARYNYNTATCSSALMNCTITGWGAGDIYGDFTQNTKFPLFGLIRLASETLSQAMLSRYPDAKLPQNSLFGFPFSGSTVQACLLDAGGMAACQMGSEWVLRGVIGEPNCLPLGTNNPMLVTDVGRFDAWINDCVNNWAACPTKR